MNNVLFGNFFASTSISQKPMLRKSTFSNTASKLCQVFSVFLTYVFEMLRKSVFSNITEATCSFFPFFLTCKDNVSKFHNFFDLSFTTSRRNAVFSTRSTCSVEKSTVFNYNTIVDETKEILETTFEPELI